MSWPIVRVTLQSLRWQIGWYGVGLAIYAAFMIWLFPVFQDALSVMASEYPPEILVFFGASGNLADPRVFIQVEYFSFVPVILVIYGVVAGTGLLAGDEGRGTLEQLLAQPISRTAVYLSRTTALFGGIVLILSINGIGWFASVPFVDLGDVGVTAFLGGTLGTVPLVAAFAGTSIFLAAISPTRGSAAGIAAALAVVSYLLSSFAQAIGAIAWMRWFTPYWYSDSHQVLTLGVVWWHQAVLILLAAGMLGAGWLAFCGREIGAGVWQPRAVIRGWRSVTASGSSGR